MGMPKISGSSKRGNLKRTRPQKCISATKERQAAMPELKKGLTLKELFVNLLHTVLVLWVMDTPVEEALVEDYMDAALKSLRRIKTRVLCDATPATSGGKGVALHRTVQTQQTNTSGTSALVLFFQLAQRAEHTSARQEASGGRGYW